MFKLLRPQAAWLASLLLASLWLAACGGAAQSTPTSQDQVGSNPTTAVTDASCASTSAGCEETPTAETEATATTPLTAEPGQAATTTEEAATATEEAAVAEPPATAVAAASPTTEPSTASQPATCQAVEIPINNKIAPVTADDWSKGSANAPVTLIEYGDFQ